MNESKDIPMVESVGVVVIQGTNVLLVKHGESATHKTNMYGTPAGRVEPGEEHVTAAKRELEEESGLVTDIQDLNELPRKYVADIERKNGEITRFNHTVFVCKRFSGSLRKTEETIPEWVEIKKVSTLSLLPNVEDMIQQAQEVTTGNI